MSDSKRLTKGELFARLKDFPDDTPIVINVDDGISHNWDTHDVKLWPSAFLCKRTDCPGHTESEMDYEIVIFAVAPEVEHIYGDEKHE
jgi:hypothetical protein